MEKDAGRFTEEERVIELILPRDICSHSSRIKCFLLEYYKDAPKQYHLVFDSCHLENVNRAFDQLIREEGIRPVFFHFLSKCN